MSDSDQLTRARSRSAWSRTAAVFTGALLVVSVAVVALDVAIIDARIHSVSIALPSPASTGQTWLIIGSDSRADVPAGARGLGTSALVPGQRADVILLVHVIGHHATLISVPRDLLLRTPSGGVERATLALLDGPQALVDGLCRTLGVAATHVVLVSMGGFAEVVDALGGVTVTITRPVRDRAAHLDLPRVGRIRLDGLSALALVRSRHPEYLQRGRWVQVDATRGAVIRQRDAAEVFAAVRAAASRLVANPLRAQRVAWVASAALRVDTRTGLGDLVDLARTDIRDTRVLAASPLPRTIAVLPNDGTRAALRAAGYSASCNPVNG